VGADATLPCSTRSASIDKATYEQPLEYSEGIQFVLVNGVSVVKRMGNSLMVFFRAGRLVRPFCNEREVAVRISCTGEGTLHLTLA